MSLLVSEHHAALGHHTHFHLTAGSYLVSKCCLSGMGQRLVVCDFGASQGSLCAEKSKHTRTSGSLNHEEMVDLLVECMLISLGVRKLPKVPEAAASLNLGHDASTELTARLSRIVTIVIIIIVVVNDFDDV